MPAEPPGPDYTHSISKDCLNMLRDWEGREAEAPLALKVINVARFLAVIPTGNGGLQLEWHCNGWDVEIEVDSNGEFQGVFAERATR